jgi:hypothetical protein
MAISAVLGPVQRRIRGGSQREDVCGMVLAQSNRRAGEQNPMNVELGEDIGW